MAAAKALHAAELARADEKRDDAEIGKLMSIAYRACVAAIYSPELADGVQVTVLNARRALVESAPIEEAPKP